MFGMGQNRGHCLIARFKSLPESLRTRLGHFNAYLFYLFYFILFYFFIIYLFKTLTTTSALILFKLSLQGKGALCDEQQIKIK